VTLKAMAGNLFTIQFVMLVSLIRAHYPNRW